MDDLVQSLRDYSAISNVTGGYPVDRPTLTGEAADEIERLRGIILSASTMAGMGRRREACELLHREVYPSDEKEGD